MILCIHQTNIYCKERARSSCALVDVCRTETVPTEPLVLKFDVVSIQ